MDLSLTTIEELICSALLWAKEPKGRGLNGHSDDGGFISLRVNNFIDQGVHYKRICIMSVTIPLKKRRVGLYSGFISSLDELSLYGIRWHDSVQNRYLAERHLKRGYFSQDDSFFKIIGAPYPAEMQNKMNKDAEESTQRLMKGLSETPGFRILKKQRKA